MLYKEMCDDKICSFKYSNFPRSVQEESVRLKEPDIDIDATATHTISGESAR